MVPLKIYYNLIKVFLLSFFSDDFKIISNQFIKTRSFRLHGQQNFFLPLKIILKNVIVLLSLNAKKKINGKDKKMENILFSSKYRPYNIHGKDSFDIRYEYVKRFKKLEDPEISIYRDKLNIYSISQKMIIIFLQIMVILLISPLYLFFPSKRNIICLHFSQYLEWVSILNHLHNFNGKNLYLFDAYENDVAFISFLAMNESYKVYIFPSLNPLINFYKYFYCTHIVLTSPYHYDELNKLDFKYKCQSFIGGPVNEFSILTKHFNIKSKTSYDYELGYFSSSSWLRKKMNLMINVGDDYTSEIKTYKFLKNYLREYDTSKFIILLHPREKRDEETFESSKNFYRNFFEKNNLEFGLINLSSTEYYKKINLKICSSQATHGSIIFCGYKSIYSALSKDRNMYAESDYLNTIAFNAKSLEKMIYSNCKISDEDFIVNKNLNKYVYKNYEHIAMYH